MSTVPHRFLCHREDSNVPFNVWHFGVCLGGWQNSMGASVMEALMPESLEAKIFNERRGLPIRYFKERLRGDVKRLKDDKVPDCHISAVTIFPGMKQKPREEMPEGFPVTDEMCCKPRALGGDSLDSGITWGGYLAFLKFFCYDTRFSVFFPEMPQDRRSLTKNWVLSNGITLDMGAGSERDWSFAYTSVRAYSKMGARNIQMWADINGAVCTNDEERLVLFHTLQQGYCADNGRFCEENDTCHCIAATVRVIAKPGFAGRVLFENPGPSFLETQKVAGDKNGFFLGDSNPYLQRKSVVDRRWIRDGVEIDKEKWHTHLHELVANEVAYCHEAYAKLNEKEVV